MLSPYQRTVDCLGPFKDVEENNRKIEKDYQEESKPKADLDRVVCEVVKNTYLRKKKLFDEREKKKK